MIYSTINQGAEKRSTRIYVVLLIAVLPLMIYLSSDYGITYDEPSQQFNGIKVFSLYFGGLFGAKTFTVFDVGDAYLYGAVFDFFCVLTYCILDPLVAITEYQARHMVNSFFGWMIIVYTSLLARRLFGSRAGIIAIVLMVFSPRFLGHCMNNPKDIPFTTFYMMAIYYFITLEKRFPFLTPKTALAIVGSIALAINVRAGGIILFGYAGLLAGYLVLTNKDLLTPGRIINVALFFGLLSITTLHLGTLFWPWAMENPVIRPFTALMKMARFRFNGDVLFSGQMIAATDVPWYYTLRWFAITTPLAVLLPGIGSFFLKSTRPNKWKIVALWFSIVFPIAVVIVLKSTLYDGLRHMLFIYPPFVALSAGFWAHFFDGTAKKKVTVTASILIFLLGMLHPVAYSFKEHPNQIVYFNELQGGTRGAFLKYDLDYWGNSYKQAIDWLQEEASRQKKTFSFTASGPKIPAQIYAKSCDNLVYVDGTQYADYLLVLLRTYPEKIEEALSQPNIAHTVTADGAPLCVILNLRFSPAGS